MTTCCTVHTSISHIQIVVRSIIFTLSRSILTVGLRLRHTQKDKHRRTVQNCESRRSINPLTDHITSRTYVRRSTPHPPVIRPSIRMEKRSLVCVFMARGVGVRGRTAARRPLLRPDTGEMRCAASQGWLGSPVQRGKIDPLV